MGVEERRAPTDLAARHGGLVQRTFLVSALTLLSRLLGFVRESLAASIFGDASPVNDAFVTAWRVPNLFRALLGEGAMSAAMQTALTRAEAERGESAGRALFFAIFRLVGWLAALACGATMLLVLLLPDELPGTGLRWLGDDPQRVRELTLRMMPFVLFVCLSAVASGALYVRGRFLAPSLAPALMNVGWIAALVWVAHRFGSRPLASGGEAELARQMDVARSLAAYALVAGAVLLAVQVPSLVAERLVPGRRPVGGSAGRESSTAWAVLRASAPLALGAAAYQVNVLVDGWMAIGLLPAGGSSLLYYATRVQQLPMALVAVAATNAVFPALAALGHVRARGDLRALHDRSQLAIAFVALPASFGLVAFAEPVISFCFEHGAFGAEGVERGAAGLRALALAILPAGAAGLVARTYYALGDFATPVRVSVAMVLLHVALNLVFVLGLGMDLEGLALSTALCAWGNLALLVPGLRGKLGLPAPTVRFVPRLLASGAAAAIAVVLARGAYELIDDGTRQTRALVASIVLSVALFAGLAHAFGIPEWRELLARLRRASAGS